MRTLLAILLLGLVAMVFLFVEGPAPREGIPVEEGSAPPDARREVTAPADPATATGAAAGQPERNEDRRVALASPAALEGRIVRTPGAGLAEVPLRIWREGHPRETVTEISTDGRGAFRIATLAAGKYLLDSTHAAIPAGFRAGPFTVRAGQPNDVGDVLVPLPARITGRVVDGNGSPMAGVRVFHSLDTSAGLLPANIDRATIDLESPGMNPSMVTGEDGRFALARILPGEVTLLAEQPGLRDATHRVTVAAGQVLDVGDLELRPGREIRGQVTDANGRPLAGARVAEEGYEGVKARKGTTTAGDGTFLLTGVDTIFKSLRVECAGYIPEDVIVQETNAAVVAVRLAPMLTLRGSVRGNRNRPTRIGLDWDVADNEELPNSCIYPQKWKEHEVDADGGFVIPGLVPGVYTLVAETPGVGRSEPTKARLTATSDPVVVTVLERGQLTITVKDTHGAPLAGATVTDDPRIRKYPALWKPLTGNALTQKLRWLKQGETYRTDNRGRVTLAVDRDQPLAILVECEGYLPDAAIWKNERIPTEKEFVLLRAGEIRGVVHDPLPRNHYVLSVTLTRREEDKVTETLSTPVDASGRFHRGLLRPGRWTVAIARNDVTREDDKTRSTFADPVPVVGEPTDSRGAKTVDVTPGATAEVRLEAPPPGTIEGRVTSVGGPVEGAVVWMVKRGAKPISGWGHDPHASWHEPDSFRHDPHCTTGDDGRFRFFYNAPGTWDLRVRYRTSAAHPAIPVQADRAGEKIQRDIVLPGAAILGRFAGKNPKSKDVSAHLYRIDHAADDPYFFTDYSTPQSSKCVAVPLDRDGNFRIEHLPAGRWVLRFGSDLGGAPVHRVVESVGDQVIDLGRVDASAAFPVSIPCRLPPIDAAGPLGVQGHGVWIRSVAEGRPPIFCDATRVQGTLSAKLPAGRYRIELFEVFHVAYWTTATVSGRSTKRFVDLEVKADGTTDPTALDFR